MKPSYFFMLLVFLGLLFSFKTLSFEGFIRPDNFPDPVYETLNVTQESFELGRKLFYETALSRDNSISCGSCHVQSAAFTQHGHDISHGIEDRLGNRNSPPIMNLAWNKFFFWDGGVFHLDLFPVSPITNPVEMDEKMENILVKLRAKPDYRQQFKTVYGSDEISANQIYKALSHFMIMCVSSDSKYDSVMRKTGAAFTPGESKGYDLFRANCSSCHKEPLFTDGSFRNNGLDNTFNPDKGRQTITLDQQDEYKFKVPSLRNLTYTLPYMHDGRFTTIDQVLDHYAKGVRDSHTLDAELKKNNTLGIALTDQEKVNLKAFLKTLDDPYFITRKDLSEQ
jgi:cytochrome c peroxidase